MKNARRVAASCATTLAALACAAGAQTIEISSPSIGTVTVRPQPIGKQPAQRAARSDERNAGVDLGIRRNRDGSLYDALDPRQNPAASADDTLPAAGTDPDRNVAEAARERKPAQSPAKR